MHTLKKFSTALCAAKLLDIFFSPCFAQCSMPSTLQICFLRPELVVQLLLFHPKTAQKAISDDLRSEHVPHVPHPSSALASCDQSRAHWTPLFKILDPPLDTHDITDNSESPDYPSIDFILKQPLNSGHPATPYNGQFSQSQLYASNT